MQLLLLVRTAPVEIAVLPLLHELLRVLAVPVEVAVLLLRAVSVEVVLLLQLHLLLVRVPEVQLPAKCDVDHLPLGEGDPIPNMARRTPCGRISEQNSE